MKDKLYKEYPHIEKSLIDYIVDFYNKSGDIILWHNIFSNEKYVDGYRRSFGYAGYNVNRAFKELKETFKMEVDKILRKV